MTKEFRKSKWLLFPVATLGLGAGIAYFNVVTFGLKQSVVYLLALALAAGFSFALTKYSGSRNRSVRITAFVCEGLTLAVLFANAAYSLKASRDLSIAFKADETQVKVEAQQTEREKAEAAKWQAISSMGRQARLSAARSVEAEAKAKPPQSPVEAERPPPVNLRSVFLQYETPLTIAAVLEMAFSVGGTFVVYGVAIFGGRRKRRRGVGTGNLAILNPQMAEIVRASLNLPPDAKLGLYRDRNDKGMAVWADGKYIAYRPDTKL